MALSLEKLGDIYAAFFQSLLEESDVRATRITVDERITGTSAVPAAYSTGLDDSLVHDVYISTAEGSTGNVYQCTLGGDSSTALWQYKFTIPAGAGGADAHVYFKYAAAEPTADGDMLDTPNAWIGIYAGTSAAAPTAYTAYTWYQWDSPPQPSDAMPLMDGTSSPGTDSEYSRKDHRHPSDTSRANKAIVSAEYKASSTYAPGAFCLHDNDFYECTTAIDMPEAWNASHWTQRTIGYVLTVLNNTKATAAQGALADTALQPGDVVNDLDTMDDDAPLSAAQGKALNDKFLSSCLWREATGKPVAVYPVPESPLSVKVSGQYTQEGAGDPSPENVRRITPWVESDDVITIKRTGKNLCKSSPSSSMSGITFTLNANGSLSIAGTASSNAAHNFMGFYGNTNPVISATGGKTFTLSTGKNDVYFSVTYYNGSVFGYSTIGSVEGGTLTFTVPEGYWITRIMCYVQGGSTVDFVLYPQLELGSITTPYEAYTESNAILTAPADIWSGWLTNEGQAADDWREKDVTSTDNSGAAAVDSNINTARFTVYYTGTGIADSPIYPVCSQLCSRRKLW